MKRSIALVLVVVLSLINGLNIFDVIELDWLIWPVALATIIAVAILLTTPTEKDLGNG